MENINSKPKYFQADISLKRVELNILEWFDRTYGNTYFAAEMIVNDKYRIVLDYQYGYGGHSETVAAETLFQMGMTKQADKGLRLLCEDARATLKVRKQDALKRELKAIS